MDKAVEVTVYLQLVTLWGVPAVDGVAFTQPGVRSYDGKVFPGHSKYSPKRHNTIIFHHLMLQQSFFF